MNKNKYYICEFCYNGYIPTRRGAQKYCSNSCRSKAYHHRKKDKELSKPESQPPKKLSNGLNDHKVEPAKTKVEEISLPGVGNAAMGSLLADGIKSFFTKNKDKPATKGDLNNLALLIKQRYHLVLNANPMPDGRKAYFDMETNEVVYRY